MSGEYDPSLRGGFNPNIAGELDPSAVSHAAVAEATDAGAAGGDAGGDFVMDSGRFMSSLGGNRAAYAVAGAGLLLGGGALIEAAPVMAKPAPAETKQDHNKRTVKETVTADGTKITVVKLDAKVVKNVNKFKKCLAEAEKEEQPAPPVDPYANCQGGVKIKINTKVEASCPKGYLGGRAVSRLSLNQWIKTRAWARAVSSGRAEAKASTSFLDKIKIKAGAWVNCVKIKPGQTPGTTPGTTPETPQTPPKDGTQGAGAGTPGQPGGPGAGGEAGDPNNGEQCLDANGNLVVGTPDQFGNC